MYLLKKTVAAVLLSSTLLMAGQAMADVRIDIKNGTQEDCSVAFNARIDKTKWVTEGWYVFMPGEEGPVLLKGANDIHDVFIYHDCGLNPADRDEVKRGWVKSNLKFTDYLPKENEDGYQEVQFVRLTGPAYVIGDK
ncbi:MULTISPECIES: hypothetical protein [unclassified Anaerobiospirillum]|uniref:hypothetical protein n=1 Tax=unclassified Anaerobiospirillum TaxID=2647410 RepID=UPI001FF3EB54|nr:MULTISPECIES: hypothetical protein [unclassified Anaerobiospirillum]MCK0526890.1 hypothetical protein [Anaerobiospirillum sp. NML120449]MCK0535803.1 hypothetical protein [Anaerobiospirillum sp. NML120511]MCK0540944.1 hypothetical protein [Anaerobiospirillum sp. NML02-A-032]